MITDTPVRPSGASPRAPRPMGSGDVPEVAARPVPARAWALSLLAYVLAQGAQLALVRHWAPRFFWFDDSQAQFGPMTWWLGQHLQGGRPPLMDPDLGMGGNVVADMQYGVLDPLHWLLQALVGRGSDFLTISWTYGAFMLLLLGAGSLCLLLQYRVRPVLAVAAAVGIGSSGFLVWYGSSWWPLLWATACLPWLWVGLRSRSAVGVLVTGLATWALLTSGNPYAFPFAALIIVGQLVEYRREYGSWRALVNVRVAARAVACVGGLVVAVPTLLAVVQLSSVMGRQGPDLLVGNAGFAVPNLADVLVGGPTLLGETSTWSGTIGLVPAMATVLVALPLAALVDWRAALRRPALVTAGLVVVGAAVATQLPTTVSVFRYPVRYLVYVEVFLPVLVLVAVTVAGRITRRRVAVAAGVACVQALLAEFRAPFFWRWHLLALVVVLVALAAALVVLPAAVRGPAAEADTTVRMRLDRDDVFRERLRGLAGDRRLASLAAVLLVLAVGAGFPIGERMMVSLQHRSDVLAHVPSDGSPFRTLDAGRSEGTTVAQFRAQSYAPGQHLTVITWNFAPDRGWAAGIVNGSGNVIAGLEPGYASLAVWQAQLNSHWCRSVWGATCSDPASLLATAGTTGVSWIDLLSSDTVLLSVDAPAAIQQHFRSTWQAAGGSGAWLRFERHDALPGRVTAADGVTVSPAGWTSGVARVGTPMDSYVVSTGNSAGTLATRIPYYPGMRATLDGRDLPVSTVEGAVLAVRVPAGVHDGRLELFYAPAGAA